MNHPRFTLAAGALALLAGFPAHSAENDSIVVTATRQAQRANELLADVSVITRAEIEAAGQTTLPEFLAHQPGIEYSASGAPGSSTSLFIRGANSEHTLVLIDGMRVNSATLGTTSLSRIPLAQIERIEILRGPASVLYGSEAIGGVIQIFTKQGSGAGAFNLQAAAGSHGTSQLAAGVSGEYAGLRYSLQASREETGGFSNVRNPSNSAYNPDHDGFREGSVSGSLAYRFSPANEVGVNVFQSEGRNDYDYGGYNPATAARDYRNDVKVSSYSFYSRNELRPGWKSTVRVGRGIDDAVYLANGVKSSSVRTEQDQAAWQNDVQLPLGKALFAAEWLEQRIAASQQYDANERTINSLLAGWNAAAAAHRWQINLRHDDISSAGAKTTGSAAYGHQFSDAWRANVSYGTAYKAPSMNDLYFPNTPSVGAGNPDLKPEFAHNREASVHYDGTSHTASLTYFDNRIEDLIQWAEQPAGYVPQNVASARITGWTLAWKGNFGAWTARASADWQDPRDTGTGLQLARRARQHASVGAEYTHGAWTSGAEIVASGERYSDTANTQRLGGYALVNLSASYRLDREISLFARVNNLFDRKYELVKDFATDGLNFLVGVRYQPK